jgi:hypothetical protein
MDQLSRAWEQLSGRIDGLFWFRCLLQPIMAGILAARAGMADAREQRVPYLWSVLSNPRDRPRLVREGFTDVSRVFICAIVIDVAYQLIVLRWIYPLQALLVAVVLALVPYALIRGPVTRLTSRRSRKRTSGDSP